MPRLREIRLRRRAAMAATAWCFAIAGTGCSGGAGRASPPVISAATPALALAAPVEHLDLLAREPMVVEHPDGTLFVSGYGSPAPSLWKSADSGATWSRVNVGTEAEGAIGNSDVDLAVARDGTLYFATMVYDRKANEGVSISIGVSRDKGASWRWTPLSKTRFDDRPWVEVAPDGTAHAIWNDGEGVCHAVSQDGGLTWKERARIHPKGGSGHLAVGPRGEVAVRVTPMSASGNRMHEDVDLIAVSTDAGASWQKHPAPGKRHWTYPISEDDPLPRWVEPLAWDARGALYSLWSDPRGLWLARSVDRGDTWKGWLVIQSDNPLYFPYLAARGEGELAATWFSGRDATLRAHVARLEVGRGEAPPNVAVARPFQPDSWSRAQGPSSTATRDPAGEYLAVAFLKDGGLGVVSPIQNGGAKRLGFSWWRVDASVR